jgi:hypothetical protein
MGMTKSPRLLLEPRTASGSAAERAFEADRFASADETGVTQCHFVRL